MGIKAAEEWTSAVPTAETEEELKRVLSSRTFTTAPRLCMLLNYICEQTIKQQLDNLTEQQIGIHIFQRSPGYNSAEDTIVRGTARHLRTRLETYYQEEGREDPIRISVPKGGYVASFDPAPAKQHATQTSLLSNHAPVPEKFAKAAIATPAPWPKSAKIALVCALLAVASLLSIVLLKQSAATPLTDPGPVALWRALFTEGRKTLIVPGDASLDAYTAWEQKQVTLQDYSNQTYQREVKNSRPPSGTDVPLAVRSVTPMADLRLVSELVRVPTRMGAPKADAWMEVRYARDIAVADTHNNNLILIGSETFNPWVGLYQPQLDFNVHWDYKTDLYSIANRGPKPGELDQYTYRRDLPGMKALTLIAFIDNSQGTGHVLLIEGTSMGTTYAAVNFITNQHLWQPALDAATDKNGMLHNFEILLGSDLVRGGVSNTKLLTVHVH